MITNKQRATRIDAAIKAYKETVGEDIYFSMADENVTDILADLRHFCDREDLDFAECDKMAYVHYSEERDGKEHLYVKKKKLARNRRKP